MTIPRRIHVYIDETGDRGASSDSSPIFGMTAVVLDETGAPAVRSALDELRSDFKVPTGETLSWKRHAKTHDRRRRASEVLGGLTGIKVCYVYSVKSELGVGTYLDNPQRFYNYIAYRTYKSTLWASRAWAGPGAQVWTRFGHVKGHDHRTTEVYVRQEAELDAHVPFEMEQGLRWVSADTYAESQAADLYGGFLKAALWPSGEFSYVEPSYLLRVWPQIRNSEDCAVPFGIMPMPHYSLLTKAPWFPCLTCTKQ